MIPTGFAAQLRMTIAETRQMVSCRSFGQAFTCGAAQMQSALLSTQQLMGVISQSCRDTLRLPIQVWKAWANAVQHSQLLRAVAEELLQRRMRSCLSEYLRSWAAHAHDMQEARRVATAHGDTVARCIRRTQMQMSLTARFWLRPRYVAYALARTAAVLPFLAFSR